MSLGGGQRVVAIIAVGLMPWTVLLSPGSAGITVDLVFAWGLVAPDTFHVVLLSTYLFDLTWGLPNYLLAWPASALLYCAGLAGAAVGAAAGREDRRLTAGLLVLAGLAHLGFALGVGRADPTVVAVPTGPIILWLVVWRYDWLPLRVDIRRTGAR